MGKLSVAYISAVKKTIQDNKRIFVRFIVSLAVSIILVISACSLTAFAAENPDGTISGTESVIEDSSVIKDLIGVDGSQPLEVILLVTILSLAPSLLVMMTSFGRIIICFSFLRTAMQTQSTPPNMVLTGLALFLTIFIMFPVFAEINEVAYQPYAKGEITTEEAIVKAGEPLKDFMLKQTTNDDMRFFLELSGKEYGDGEITIENYKDELGFEVVIPAFILSELKRAFQMGFLIFIPFLVIDLVVSSTLMAMGMMMLPPAMISLPFKIMLFVLVDGWQLMVGTLVSSYNL
ncbi:MAG: flagellar type III secretion system pore protein FliP [Ruminococcaceae bacterium]|nr:flagellar type III secretion system pore protein FliP [Oscillospiraceae bacterium]